jgi:hypothetical protein
VTKLTDLENRVDLLEKTILIMVESAKRMNIQTQEIMLLTERTNELADKTLALMKEIKEGT